MMKIVAKILYKISVILIFSLLFIGCMSTNRSYLYKNFKKRIIPNNNISVSVFLFSNLDYSRIVPYEQYKEKLVPKHKGYYFHYRNLFETMLNEYLAIKYPVQEAENVLRLVVNIDDFWIEEYPKFSRYSLDGLIDWLYLMDMEYTLSSRLKLTVNLYYNGEERTRKIDVSSNKKTKITKEDINNYQNDFNNLHYYNILDMNNKALFGLNTLLLELGF